MRNSTPFFFQEHSDTLYTQWRDIFCMKIFDTEIFFGHNDSILNLAFLLH